MGFYGQWPRYVPVAERRARAARKVAGLKKKGRNISPVAISGRTIARSFWGKSWCANLESYSDFENRLPRGRSYLRNGSVVDMQIAKGKVVALVAGSELYHVSIAIAPVKAKCWTSICNDCAGSIDSLVELLQGKFSKAVMDRVCRKGDGLFPAPKDIKLDCSCPDWAEMCKHVAAVLYGVGARLDDAPDLLFALRDVDAGTLIASAGRGLEFDKTAPASGKRLDDGDVAALFGLDMDEDGDEDGDDNGVDNNAGGKTPGARPRAKTSRSRKATPARNRATMNGETKKSAGKKAAGKKAAAKKQTGKKIAAKKAEKEKKTAAKTAAAKKPIAKRTAAKRTAVKTASGAKRPAKKTGNEKAAAKNMTTREATRGEKRGAKRPANKTAAASKSVTNKPAARKATSKKPTLKKAAAKKGAAKRGAAKKAVASTATPASKGTRKAGPAHRPRQNARRRRRQSDSSKTL